MKEIGTPKIPLCQEEIERRKTGFPRALHSLGVVEKLLREKGSYNLEGPCEGGEEPKTFIIDSQVLQAMSGGILGMYRELVQAGEKEFADRALQESKK